MASERNPRRISSCFRREATVVAARTCQWRKSVTNPSRMTEAASHAFGLLCLGKGIAYTWIPYVTL
jgi:hypothetical protein